MRCLAVYLVVVFHAGWSIADNGFVGVDLFFVLSGFLVTNVLLGDLAGPAQRVRLGRFYARRVRRLLPAAAFVILTTAVVFLVVVPVTERLDLVDDARAAALYVANWHFVAEATDYFAAEGSASPYLHFWSLAIEEQFYVAFPVVLMVLAALDRRRRGALLVGLVGLAAVGVVAQIVWSQTDAVRAYYGTDARVYQLLVGAVVAVVMRTTTVARRSRSLVALAGIVALLLIATPVASMSASTRGLIAAAASVAVIVGLEVSPQGIVGRTLSRPTVVALGRISYGTYLWHWPVILVAARVTDLGPIAMTAVAVALATGLAALSARFLETPIRRSVRLDRVPVPTIAAGLALSVMVGVVAPVLLQRDTSPLLADDGSSLSDTERETYGRVPDGVDWAAVRGDDQADLPPFPVCGVGALDDCVTVSGDGRERILVVGDSHARMLLPVLERLASDDDATLMVAIELGCPWIDGLETLDRAGADRCNGRRTGWSTQLVADLQPTRVILVQRELGDLAGERRDEAARLARATVDNLTGAGVEVTIVDPVPEATEDPIDCMAASTWVASCTWVVPAGATATERLLDDDIPGVRRVDLDRVACPGLPVCSPYLDGAFVRRDEHHVQPSWWMAHRDEVRLGLGL